MARTFLASGMARAESLVPASILAASGFWSSPRTWLAFGVRFSRSFWLSLSYLVLAPSLARTVLMVLTLLLARASRFGSRGQNGPHASSIWLALSPWSSQCRLAKVLLPRCQHLL